MFEDTSWHICIIPSVCIYNIYMLRFVLRIYLLVIHVHGNMQGTHTCIYTYVCVDLYVYKIFT